MFGKKMVSTKNLYLILLKPTINMEWQGYFKVWHYGKENIYAFAYKLTNTFYIDFFTGTVYEREGCLTKNGDYVIREAKPLVTEHKKIPISILKEQLQELNQTSLEVVPKQKTR